MTSCCIKRKLNILHKELGTLIFNTLSSFNWSVLHKYSEMEIKANILQVDKLNIK